mmetsp:Transcript_28914/g.53121  ORF Transcript_28914/g.53121 Transcript_28914/m.53121 type:complete len:339 (-) Transcript_28914:1187-2203(-)
MKDLKDFVLESPLLATCALNAEDIEKEWDTWIKLGEFLIKELNFDKHSLQLQQKERIYQYYLPVFFWVWKQERLNRKQSSEALVIGISAPQGCGKTSLVQQLCNLLSEVGLTAAAASIDDFYLTYEDQNRLRQQNPENPLLQLRGNAGTHDVELGARVLRDLKSFDGSSASSNSEMSSVLIPRYDKSAYGGRGDRFPESQWHKISSPPNVILLEGWMLGFRPVASSEAIAVHPGLERVNALLAKYESAWDSLIDAWLVIKVKDINWVFEWRLEAEEAMKRTGRPGMAPDQIRDFVNRFMPAYQAYLPGLHRTAQNDGLGKPVAIIEVDHSRRPLKEQD